MPPAGGKTDATGIVEFGLAKEDRRIAADQGLAITPPVIGIGTPVVAG